MGPGSRPARPRHQPLDPKTAALPRDGVCPWRPVAGGVPGMERWPGAGGRRIQPQTPEVLRPAPRHCPAPRTPQRSGCGLRIEPGLAGQRTGERTGQLPGREAGPPQIVRLSPRSGELGLLRVTVIFTSSGGWNPPRRDRARQGEPPATTDQPQGWPEAINGLAGIEAAAVPIPARLPVLGQPGHRVSAARAVIRVEPPADGHDGDGPCPGGLERGAG
jgi:hypothetical protein